MEFWDALGGIVLGDRYKILDGYRRSILSPQSLRVWLYFLSNLILVQEVLVLVLVRAHIIIIFIILLFIFISKFSLSLIRLIFIIFRSFFKKIILWVIHILNLIYKYFELLDFIFYWKSLFFLFYIFFNTNFFHT